MFHLHSPLVVLMSLKCPLKDTTQSQSTSQDEDDKLDQAIISFCFCFYQNRQTGRKIDDESLWKSPIYHRQDTFPLLTFFLFIYFFCRVAEPRLCFSWLEIIWKMDCFQVFDKLCRFQVPLKFTPHLRKLLFTSPKADNAANSIGLILFVSVMVSCGTVPEL